MAKPNYAAVRGGFGPGGFNHGRFGNGRSSASSYDGNAPPYSGVAQPAPDGTTFLGFFGNGTPVYLVPPGTIKPRE